MDKPRSNPIFKKGIWIKEQQGTLTMGSLDGKETLVLPDDLCAKIFAFEHEMQDALYGENRQTFSPELIDMDRLFLNIKARFRDKEIKISFLNPQKQKLRGNYDEIFTLLEKFVLSSCSPKKEEKILIYISASILQDQLCLIYRDSHAVSDPSRLKAEFAYITDRLKGEITYKKTAEARSYYDIMIPLNP